jgi:hypothetical protein
MHFYVSAIYATCPPDNSAERTDYHILFPKITETGVAVKALAKLFVA